MDRLAWRLGIVRLVHIVQARTDKTAARRGEYYRQFYEEHRQELQRLRDMLEDDLSRTTLDRVQQYRQTGDANALKGVVGQIQYFQPDIFGPAEDEVFVDGGAYVGDTVESFFAHFGGRYRRIYVWEPDEASFQALKRNLRRLDDIVYVPCGMWREKTELLFRADGSLNAKVVEDTGEKVVRIPVDSIDNVCAQDRVTFIKMDIEGSELAALEGAVRVIKRDKPRLAISVYHRPEDLYAIPFWIRQTVPEYKLYLRHHSYRGSETVLYATV